MMLWPPMTMEGGIHPHYRRGPTNDYIGERGIERHRMRIKIMESELRG